jgi:hypothetical protein
MLTQRSIDKIGRHLEDEGWTDDEINTALNELNINRGVVNVALPLHFKEEALFHAKCHCKYVLGLRESSQKYEKAFEKAYSTYLIEAFENSRGIEGPNSGSHKRGNPAGIEVHAFDGISDSFITKAEKEEITKKAPAGLVYMGQDKWLQQSVSKMDKELKGNRDLLKNIMTQYSASVVSLSNAFLFAFGGYQTKRRYANTRIYGQTKEGLLETPNDGTAQSTLEFSKGQDKEKMLEVAYRQITRQLYIISVNTIVSAVMALDKSFVRMLEEGVKKRVENIWDKTASESQKKKGMNLAFVLKRETRNSVIESFYQSIDKKKDYLKPIEQSVVRWADSSSPEIPLIGSERK